MIKANAILEDYGEFRLLREIVFPAMTGGSKSLDLGDDCATLELPQRGRKRGSLVVTMDGGPEPLAWRLGEQCYRSLGWHLVLVNASDIAAAGGMPLGFTSSIEAPGSLEVTKFRDLVEGIAEACKKFGFRYAGGNLRSAEEVRVHGAAIGVVEKRGLSRGGCRPGQVAAVIGEIGGFMTTYLKAKHAGIRSLGHTERSKLLFPHPALKEMRTLVEAGIVVAATDNSDGLLGAFWNLAESSSCGFEIDLDERYLSRDLRKMAELEHCDPWNIFFSWGDWQILVVVEKDALKDLERLSASAAFDYAVIGTVVAKPRLWGKSRQKEGKLRVLRNENLTKTSYASDPEGSVGHLLHTSIWDDEE